MLLTFKVISYRQAPTEDPIVVCLDHQGGVIGRAQENEMILPDSERHISRKHAEVHYAKEKYTLTDVSSHGTYIDGSETPLGNAGFELQDGTKIRIGDYEILASLIDAAEDESTSIGKDLFLPNADTESPEIALQEDTFSALPQGGEEAESFAEELFGGLQSNEPDSDASSDVKNRRFPPKDNPVLQESANYRFAAAKAPDDAQLTDLFDDSETIELPAEAAETNISASDTAIENQPQNGETIDQWWEQNSPQMFDAFLQGARLTDSSLFDGRSPEDTMRLMGELFREWVEGMTSVLGSMAELNSHFGLPAPLDDSAAKDGLSFSGSVSETLVDLVRVNRQNCPEPESGIKRGFAEITNHQVAMIAGIRAALAEFIKRLDPEQFEKPDKGFFLTMNSKSWNAFTQAYPGIAQEAAADFLGDTFVRAYAKQIRMLKSDGDEQ